MDKAGGMVGFLLLKIHSADAALARWRPVAQNGDVLSADMLVPGAVIGCVHASSSTWLCTSHCRN